MITEVSDKEQYIEFFNNKNLSFLQSYQWAEVKRPEWEPVRISVDEYPITILRRKLPFFKKYLAYIPRPFFDTGIRKEILEEVVKYLKEKQIYSHLEIDPSCDSTVENQNIFNELNFFNSGQQYQLDNTNIIDISNGLDSIWESLESQTRNKVRKPEKIGCKVESFHNGQEAVDRFWNIMNSITKNTTYVAHPKEYFQKVWEIMSEADMATIVLISLDGKDLGGYMGIRNNGTFSELYGGLNTEGREVRGAGYFLKWESIKKAYEDGIKLYDQWGVSPLTEKGEYQKNTPLYHISLFKKEFNGKHISYLQKQTYVFDMLSYKAFNIAKKIFDLLLKIKKSFRK
jgi:lipid II:glycine glycyltransferase (peptidoglycan interpeptide bridge formation enzyme)